MRLPGGRALAITRRELWGYFLSPIAWVVLALFLLLEGLQFVLFVRFLAQPGAPHGEVMRYLFGGTILFWVGTILVATALPMRLLAEERRSGTLETLLTAPVTAIDVVLGKGLAALLFYAFLWAPTGLYVWLLVRLAPAGGGPDLGAVAATYLGVLAIGAAYLAVGLLASSVTSNQVVAAVLAFVILLVVTVAGVFDVFPGAAWQGRLLGYINLLHAMEDMARGIVDSRPLVYLASVGIFALALAVRAVDRKVATDRAWGRASLALFAALLVMANWMASRHWRRADLTRAQIHALSPKSIALVARLDRPIDVYVFMAPADEESAALASDVREILTRMQSHGKELAVRFVDKDESPDEARRLKARFHIGDAELARGLVVFAAGDRVRFVSADDLADYRDDEELGAQRLVALKAEGAFDGALLEVTRPRAPRACFTRGHDEEPFDPATYSGDFGAAARALARDGDEVTLLDGPRAEVPSGCDLVIAAGARRAFSADEVAALGRYLDGGGRLLVLYDELAALETPTGAFAATGLEPLLLRFGVRVRPAIAIDPGAVPEADLPLTWETATGYGPGPIGRALAGHLTRHALARVIEPAPREGVTAEAVVTTSAAGWGESDLASLRLESSLSFDPASDLQGPVAALVAAERSRPNGRPARVAVFGDALSFVSDALDAEADYDADLFTATCAWLGGERRAIDVGPKVPEQTRLRLDDAALHRLEGVTLVALPLLALAFGLAIAWVRRR